MPVFGRPAYQFRTTAGRLPRVLKTVITGRMQELSNCTSTDRYSKLAAYFEYKSWPNMISEEVTHLDSMPFAAIHNVRTTISGEVRRSDSRMSSGHLARICGRIVDSECGKASQYATLSSSDEIQLLNHFFKPH